MHSLMSPSYTNPNTSTQTQKRETIKVCIRIRPLLPHEDIEYWTCDSSQNTISSINATNSNTSSSSFSQPLSNNPLGKVLIDSIYSAQTFHFDKVFSQEASSQQIYKDMCRELTKNLLIGINGSIFTYGQTTSGKTYTMLGNPRNPGILPCVLKDLFDLINKDNSINDFKVYCSYVEIYNESIHDLLTDANSLKLIDDSKYGVIVANAQKTRIYSFEEGIKLKDLGEENRKYRDTLINEYSSRSHTIFQLFVEYLHLETEMNTVTSRYSMLNLIDLAGSEKLAESESSSGETGYINKSLFALANVINKLAESKHSHIPYRDSKLTRLLSMALGGNALITLICNVSPSASNYFQTLSTLRFASRAKVVKLKPDVNEYYDEKEVLELYRNEIKRMQDEIINEEDEDEQQECECKETPQNEDFKMKYYNEVLNNKKLKIENEKLQKEIDSAFKTYYNNANNNNNTNNQNENNFLLPYINQLTSLLNNNNNNNNINSYYLSSLNQLSHEYQNQLNTLQDFYLNKIKDLHIQITSAVGIQQQQETQKHSVQKTQPLQLNVKTFFELLNNRTLFDHIPLVFNSQNTIQVNKAEYERISDLLENTFMQYKSFIEEYYAKISSNCNDQQMKYEINNEYNVCLTLVNEAYENKQSELESNFFTSLRQSTSFKRN